MTDGDINITLLPLSLPAAGREENFLEAFQFLFRSRQAGILFMDIKLRDFRTGPYANDRLQLGKAWQDFTATVGAPADSELAKWVSSGEIINKSGTRLGFELARTLGSREAQNIVQQAIATNQTLRPSRWNANHRCHV